MTRNAELFSRKPKAAIISQSWQARRRKDRILAGEASSVHRARYAGVVCPDKHLRKKFYLPVGPPCLRAAAGKLLKVMLDVSMILIRWDYTVAFEDATAVIELVTMIKNAPWHFDSSDAGAAFWG